MNRLSNIEEAITEIRLGNAILIYDGVKGNFFVPAQIITEEHVSLMNKYGNGSFFISVFEKHLEEYQFIQDSDEVDPKTGNSIGKSLKNIVNRNNENGMNKLIPAKAHNEGVLANAKLNEAGADLANLAGYEPIGIMSKVLNTEGLELNLEELLQLSNEIKLKIISIDGIVGHRNELNSVVMKSIEVALPSAYGNFRIAHFQDITNNKEHVAIIKGSWNPDESVLLRIHSSCITGDIFGSCRCDCGLQLRTAMQMIEAEGKGLVLYLFQEGRGIGLLNKLKAYELQEQGYDTVEANLMLGFKSDERNYTVAAKILTQLGVSNIRLLTNNPSKAQGLSSYGLKIVESVPIEMTFNESNIRYMQTKKEKMGHQLTTI